MVDERVGRAENIKVGLQALGISAELGRRAGIAHLEGQRVVVHATRETVLNVVTVIVVLGVEGGLETIEEGGREGEGHARGPRVSFTWPTRRCK